MHLEVILKTIKEDGLMAETRKAGQALIEGLHSIVSEHPGTLSAARGAGTLCALDVSSGELRDRIVQRTLDLGCLIGACGPRSIRFRPPITFKAEAIIVLSKER